MLRRLVSPLSALAVAAVATVPAVASSPLAFTGTAGGISPYQSPGVSPPGANDWSCRPGTAHPEPVVLVHGTFGDMTVSWNELAPALANDGYCVFALDYGNRATGPTEESAQQLATFIDHVLTTTGANKVSIVGHSQGGMMPRYYLKYLGGASKVDDLIGLAPSNHGTTSYAQWAPYAYQCTACTEQMAGSQFLSDLNSGGDTLSGVSYTVVSTTHDEVVTPYSSQALSGAAGQVTNVVLQDKCSLDSTDHLGIVYDPVAVQWVENALVQSGPADPAFTPTCG
jgi:triacylglycerol lipase